MNYIVGIGDALSQLAGWVFRYTRHPNQSISGRAFENMLEGKDGLYRVINGLFFWQDNHCLDAWLIDEQRAKDDIALKAATREKYGDYFNG